LPSIFEFPLSCYVSPYIFRRFDLFSQSQIYQSPRRHILTTSAFHHTHISYTFSKFFFKIFWTLFWGPLGLLHSIFEFPFSRYISPYFFRRFELFSQSQIYQSPRRHILHTSYISYTFSKNFFSKFLGPFFGAPGALALYFRIPLLPLHIPILFRRFDLFCTSFFKVFNLLMKGSPCTNRVTNLWAVTQTWPLFFTPTTSTSPPPSPLHHEAEEPNLHRHPYTKTSTATSTPKLNKVQGKLSKVHKLLRLYCR